MIDIEKVDNITADDLTILQIARILNVEEGTVRIYLSRGFAHVKPITFKRRKYYRGVKFEHLQELYDLIHRERGGYC